MGQRVWGQLVNKVRAKAPRAPTSLFQLPPQCLKKTAQQYKDTTPATAQQGNSILTSLKIGTFQKAEQYKILTCKCNSQRSSVNGPLRKGDTATIPGLGQGALGPSPLTGSTWLSHPTDSGTRVCIWKEGMGTWAKNIRRVREDNQYFSGRLPNSRDGGGSVKGYRVGWQKGEKGQNRNSKHTQNTCFCPKPVEHRLLFLPGTL